MSEINPGRIHKALQIVRELEKELVQALADEERPLPDPLPKPVSFKPRGVRRLVS